NRLFQVEMIMSDLGAFFGPNAGYVLELYDRYLADPASVDSEWQRYFAELDATLPATNGKTSINGASVKAAPAATAVKDVSAIVGAATLAQAIREYGHLAARIDPLGNPPPGSPDLELATHGLTEEMLASLPPEV